MNAVKWIVGPQLIGAIFVLAGLISARFPPKKINSLYGYRTPSSMKNQETWDEANRFASRYMIKSGCGLLALGLLIAFIFSTGAVSAPIENLLRPILLIAVGITSAVVLITVTEKHLSKTFGNQ